MDVKRVKVDSSLANHLPITDHSLMHNNLAKIKRHYDLYYEEPHMNHEKLQNLVTSKVDIAQKVKWLDM